MVYTFVIYVPHEVIVVAIIESTKASLIVIIVKRCDRIQMLL